MIYRLLIFILLFSSNALAVDYYVDQARPDDTGNGLTLLTAKKYINSGMALQTPGNADTLYINDGTYSNASDSMTSFASGTAGNYTTIKAINNGEVNITIDFIWEHTDTYLEIEGLKWTVPETKGITGNHNKFLRCIFEGSAPTGNAVIVNVGTGDFDDTAYILLEECVAYGLGGRYKFSVFNADRVIFRRCLVRNDGGWTSGDSNPEAGIAVYNSSNVEVQNCIVIDSDLETYDNDNVGAFYFTGHNDGNPASDNAHWNGCIALNNKKSSWNIDTNDLGVGGEINNCIGFDMELAGVPMANHARDININHMTIGEAQANHGISDSSDSGTLIAVNTIIYNIFLNAAQNSTISYCDTYNTADDGSGTGVIHIDPEANGLTSLLDIDSGSVLDTAGNGGTYVGARILKQYGRSGTLHGETGYNLLQDGTAGEADVDLWPFPNEQKIREYLSAIPTIGTRGFCAGTASAYTPSGVLELSEYIAAYLGDYTLVAEIYGTSPPVTTSGTTSGGIMNANFR